VILESLRIDGILAAPVRSIAALKQKYISAPSSTVRFRTVGKGGLRATVLEPTWFLFEGKTLPFSSEPSKPGEDAAAILSELGFTPDEAEIMVADKSVGQVNWQHLKSETT
jgi:crotonobetainyl-CoA:carnitine CoA-transferase CaiB-like acyl-CoA transferase